MITSIIYPLRAAAATSGSKYEMNFRTMLPSTPRGKSPDLKPPTRSPRKRAAPSPWRRPVAARSLGRTRLLYRFPAPKAPRTYHDARWRRSVCVDTMVWFSYLAEGAHPARFNNRVCTGSAPSSMRYGIAHRYFCLAMDSNYPQNGAIRARIIVTVSFWGLVSMLGMRP